MLVYVGTSSTRAPLLAALGQQKIRVHTDLEEARNAAIKDAITDLAHPVVLCANVDVTRDATACIGPCALEVFEVVAESELDKHIAFQEEALLSEAVTGILKLLDAGHSMLRKAIDVGKGDSPVDVPHVDDLRRAMRALRGKDPDGDDRDKAHKLARNGLNKHIRKIKDTIGRGLNIPRKKKKKVTKTSSWTPSKKKLPVNPKFGPVKTLVRDIELEGLSNGKKVKRKLKAGTTYRTAKVLGGVSVWYPGIHGAFVVSPSDVGKLK